MLMKKAKDKQFWDKVRTDIAYQSVVEKIKEYYETTRYEEIPALKYHSRKSYYDNGNRSEFEGPYFRRRTYLSSVALLVLIYPEKKDYLDELQEIIWAICEEYSWVLPAHCDDTLEAGIKHIDLFSAETAFALAEISYMLEERLDEVIFERIKTEIEHRILHNYENGNFGWEEYTNNWVAVCGGNIGGALMYLFPEQFQKLLPRIQATMERFLEGYPGDGTCLEGVAYWTYGFGNYVWFADLLKQFTDGQIDLMKKEKVEKISSYAQNNFLCGNATVSYADGRMSGKVNVVMQDYLSHIFPDSVHSLPTEVTEYQKVNVMWMTYFRSLYYFDLIKDPQTLLRKDIDLPDAGQVVINRENYSLAVKAGHNDEPHNHNDVGNFIVATQKGQIFCDLGAGSYTRQYFEPETRYNIFCNGSQGHNVPIIDGNYQKEGKKYFGIISHSENVITIEMANAYGAGVVDKLTRKFIYDNQGFKLIDCFSPDSRDVIERFITLHEPTVEMNRVIVNGVALKFDAKKVCLNVSQIKHENHDRNIDTVHCIDFEVKHELDNVEFMFEIIEE